MGFVLAIKRSYRYFIPRSLQTPRKFVRDHYAVMFFYFLGLQSGMYWCAPPGSFERISTITGVGLAILLVLKWWAGAWEGKILPSQ
jgi:hypothetical protein